MPLVYEPWRVVLADLNHDNKLDAVVHSLDVMGFFVLPGNGAGGFGHLQKINFVWYAFAVTVGDVDGDGNLDALTPNNSNASFSVFLGNGTGLFASPVTFTTGGQPNCVALGDVNLERQARRDHRQQTIEHDIGALRRWDRWVFGGE
mgnify:CR=1 FL=1